MGWNCNGWGRDKAASKTAIITTSNASAFFLCETCRRVGEELEIPGYTFIGHNRAQLHKNACAGSGGVAILLSDEMLHQYNVNCVNTNYESMMAVQLVDKKSEHIMVLICLYIPPESSSYGWGADVLY